MQVSVIIPTFNRARTLPRALNSVLSETEISFEIIVVDDGSTDETKALIDDFKRRRPEIRYVYQNNRGPASARNEGIKKAGGTCVAFLDSDDEWLPGKLKAQLDFFERNPAYLISQTEEIWIRNGRRVNPMEKHRKSGGYVFEPCVRLCMVSPSCVAMRRTFFDRVGLFDETFPACEDYDLWLRSSAQLPIGLIERAYVIKHGGHADQRSREFAVMDQFRVRALRNILESGRLDAKQVSIACRELVRKCGIVIRGARRRGKQDVVAEYEGLIRAMMRFAEERDDPRSVVESARRLGNRP